LAIVLAAAAEAVPACAEQKDDGEGEEIFEGGACGCHDFSMLSRRVDICGPNAMHFYRTAWR
jgi:hypothetical protein